MKIKDGSLQSVRIGYEGRISVALGFCNQSRGGYRTAAASKMERLVIIVNGWKLLTVIIERSILDVAAVLDPPL